MTEQELRALVREAVARQLGSSVDAGGPSTTLMMQSARQHASHALFVLPAGDGSCMIEPTVQCNHCGYCKSLGH